MSLKVGRADLKRECAMGCDEFEVCVRNWQKILWYNVALAN